MLAYALWAIYNQSQQTSYIEEFLPALVDYWLWWANTRDVDGDGLVVILHSWESGLDASPAYDLAYGITEPKPALIELYSKFVELVLEYNWRYDWNQTEILAREKSPDLLLDSWFVVQVRARTQICNSCKLKKMQDVGVNSVYAAGWGVLATLATIIDDTTTASMCLQRQLFAEQAIVAKMWNSTLNRFVSRYKVCTRLNFSSALN